MRLPWTRLGLVAGLSVVTLGVALGTSGRLTYHEAFVAQAAREMIASGDVVVPTMGGRPWLEKPPLAIWMSALTGWLAGGVSETAARAPSAVMAGVLALTVAALAARRFGTSVGLLAGLIQATTTWTVMRGRLAEVDMDLAALIALTLVAFDHLRGDVSEPESMAIGRWRWGFFAGLGGMSLAKGIGFGAVLTLATVVLTMLWDRDRVALRRLKFAPGWILSAVLALAWPLLAAARHPSALRLWLLHVTDRLSDEPEHFIGQTWWGYLAAILGMLLPWLPLTIGGAARSISRAFSRSGRFGGERLLWAWLAAPLVLLSFATVKNAHYAIHALPPCSLFAAWGLIRLGARLQATRGWTPLQARRGAWASFATLGLAYALGFALLSPRIDRRGVEWGFYQLAAAKLRPGEPVSLLYHVPEWDRFPYETPFGPVPHDWGVRLYYLGRPATCRFGLDALKDDLRAPSLAVIGRADDLPGLSALGQVETLAVGPETRRDRSYRLYRVTPPSVAAREGESGRR
jgi:4-amino-4-deoxy-L-arabinose transferase-like glycosyltransferase